MHHRVATRSALVYTCNQRPGYRHTPMARTVRLALSQVAQTATTSPEATESTAKKRSCDATLLGTGTNAAPPIDATHDEALPHCIAATARTESLLPSPPHLEGGLWKESTRLQCWRAEQHILFPRVHVVPHSAPRSRYNGIYMREFCTTPPRRLSKLDHSTRRRRGVGAEKGSVGFDSCPTFVTELVVAG